MGHRNLSSHGVNADGTFSGEASGRRAGVTFATPREGTATLARLAPGTGLYMTPSAGGKHLVATTSNGKTTWSVSDQGTAPMDARTTVLSFLLLPPMLANPFYAMAQAQLEWLAERATDGWPALEQAARGWDGALAAGRDPADDADFKAGIQSCLSEIGSAMPEPAPTQPAFGTNAQPLGSSAYTLSGAGVRNTWLAITSDDTDNFQVEPRNRVGAALDCYYMVQRLDPASFPDGIESNDFRSPGLLTQQPLAESLGATGSGFVSARSYASYADVIGNSVSWISTQLSGVVAPASSTKLLPRQYYLVMLFTGAFPGTLPPEEHDYVRRNYGPQAAAAFRHNVATAVIEALQVVPFGEVLVGDEAGTAHDVIQGVLTQALADLEALTAQKSPSAVTADDVYAVIFNATKAAVDTAVSNAANNGTEWGIKKAATWLKKGAKTAFKTVLSIPGKVAKGGAASNRALRMVLPESLVEKHLVAVGYQPPQSAPLTFADVVSPDTLGDSGNAVRVQTYGTVVAEGRSFATTGTERFCNSMDPYEQCALTIRTNGGGKARGFRIQFSDPARFRGEGRIDNNRRYVWRWTGYKDVKGAYVDGSGNWVHATQSGSAFSADVVDLYGSSFTGTAKSRYRVYTMQVNGTETWEESDKTFNFVVTFQ